MRLNWQLVNSLEIKLVTAKIPDSPKEEAGKIFIKELSEFIIEIQQAAPSWPGFNDQEMAEYIAKALMRYGAERDKSISLPQTIAHELQDLVCESDAEFYLPKQKNLLSSNKLPNSKKNFHGKLIIYRGDNSPAEKVACIITFYGSGIELKYDLEENVFFCWTGVEQGQGHYILNAAKGGKATLHQLNNSKYLEGFWAEGGSRGMWRIEVGRSIGMES